MNGISAIARTDLVLGEGSVGRTKHQTSTKNKNSKIVELRGAFVGFFPRALLRGWGRGKKGTRSLLSPPPPPSFHFLLSSHFSCGPNVKFRLLRTGTLATQAIIYRNWSIPKFNELSFLAHSKLTEKFLAEKNWRQISPPGSYSVKPRSHSPAQM